MEELNYPVNMNPCDICLEKECKGNLNKCNCSECKLAATCPRFLHATIRITNKCTQECSHCCFSSSPKSNIMMSIDMARKIEKFLISNDILSLNIMGGEFFCNPDWEEIINIFSERTVSIRLVSNGDWVVDNNLKERIKSLKNLNKIRIHISKDKWHNNKNSEEAYNFLKDNGIKTKITLPKEATDSSIVPIGRGEQIYGMYSFIGGYCENPLNKYSFLIDEYGEIFKCPFGVWNYANVMEYQDGGFAERFKELNKIFYKSFIPSCRDCITQAFLKKRIISNYREDDIK